MSVLDLAHVILWVIFILVPPIILGAAFNMNERNEEHSLECTAMFFTGIAAQLFVVIAAYIAGIRSV